MKNFLAKIQPWMVRKTVYYMATVAAAGWAVYEVTGDWKDGVGPALLALVNLMAGVKTNAESDTAKV